MISYRLSHSYFCLVTICFVTVLLFAQSVPVHADETIFLPLIQSNQPPTETLVGAAGVKATTALVQLVPGADITQLSANYGVTVLGSIPALSLYRVRGTNPQMLPNLANDSRVVVAQTDNQVSAFDAQQRELTGTGSDFDALQRYFGFGSGDGSTNNNSVPGKKPKEQVLVTAGNKKLNESWQTWGQNDIHLQKAQKRSTGAGVTIAVLDTGADLMHPLLIEHLMPGYDFVENDAQPLDVPNNFDDDEDGVVDEGVGHGTHVTGIIATVAPRAAYYAGTGAQ